MQDTNPSGQRTDVTADEFFVFVAGDKAQYNATTPFGIQISVAREVIAGPDAQGRTTIRESAPANPSFDLIIERWQRHSDGLMALDYLGDGAPPGFKALVGDILFYPTPFYPVGSMRTLVRQGGLGADLDGDGVHESFKLELRQEFVGFETGRRGGRQERRARFKNTVVFLVQPSRLDARTVTIESTEEAVFAAHLGLISAVRSEKVNNDRGCSDYCGLSSVNSGVLAGRDVNTAWNAGTTRYVPLDHFSVVFEPITGYYYAGLALGHTAAPGAIARVDPVTGETRYSVGLGGDVWSIAVSADGTAIYAGLRNRNEIVKLSLPDLQVTQRIAIDPGNWAYGLAVSPANANVFAFYPGNSLRGPTLVRSGMLQPDGPGFFDARAEDTTDPMAFSHDGERLHLFGTASRRGLLQLDVVASGLSSQVRISSEPFLGRSLSRSGENLVVGNALFRTTDLARLSVLSDTSILDCRPLSGTSKWVCSAPFGSGLSVAVVDTGTMALINDGVIPFGRPPNQFGAGSARSVVPGPRGQVVISVNDRGTFWSNWLALFNNDDLR